MLKVIQNISTTYAFTEDSSNKKNKAGYKKEI